jgi:hypothetical protein
MGMALEGEEVKCRERSSLLPIIYRQVFTRQPLAGVECGI